MWIAAGALVVLAIIMAASIRATRREKVLVQTSFAELKQVLTSKVTASGEIRAKEFVDLQSELAGEITEIAVREGDKVKKGDILLRIDPIQTAADTNAQRANYEAQLSEVRGQEFQILIAEANLARDEASLKSSLAELEQEENRYLRAQNSFQRQQQLHEDGLISREEYEIEQSNFKLAKSQLEVAKARLAQAETQVRVSKNNIEQMKTSLEATRSRAKAASENLNKNINQLEKTTLVSPLDGVVTQLLVEKGERAVPGNLNSPQATLMTIADLSIIQAELKVDETDIVNLTLGNAAEITVDALPDIVFQGEVSEIGNSPINASSSSSQQEAKDFKVIVTLKDPSPKLRPGLSCTGDVITDTRYDVLVVPIQALTVREVEVDKDGNYKEPDISLTKSSLSQAKANNEEIQEKELEGLFVINSEKIARFRPVKTGITGETDIEITENLKEGEEVVSGSFQTLRNIEDGALVKIENREKS